jgi:hypothetical protein
MELVILLVNQLGFGGLFGNLNYLLAFLINFGKFGNIL